MEAKIIEDKLHIYFDCDSCYTANYQGRRNEKLNWIGQVLRNIVWANFQGSRTVSVTVSDNYRIWGND